MLKTIIIILSTLLCITNTNASAKIEKQNIYYARYGGGKPYLSDKVEYFEIDGNTAYCIEPGMPISTTDYIEMNELPYSNDIIEKMRKSSQLHPKAHEKISKAVIEKDSPY